VQVHDFGERGQREYAANNAVFQHHETQLLPAGAESPRQLEQGPDAGAVEVIGMTKIEDESRHIIRNVVEDSEKNVVGVGRVDLAADLDDRHARTRLHPRVSHERVIPRSHTVNLARVDVFSINHGGYVQDLVRLCGRFGRAKV
jgi:hypothetical protein